MPPSSSPRKKAATSPSTPPPAAPDRADDVRAQKTLNNLLPTQWRLHIEERDQAWISKALFDGKSHLRPQLQLWTHSPQPALIYNQAPASPAPFFGRRFFLWIPYRMWKLGLRCIRDDCDGQELTSCGLYKTVRQVIDIDSVFYMGTEYLECGLCHKKYAAWSSAILEQLDVGHRAYFPAMLTYRYACSNRLLMLLKERGLGLGDSVTQLYNKLCEQHREAWVARTAQYLTACKPFAKTPPEPPPEMTPLPQPKWLMSVYARYVLQSPATSPSPHRPPPAAAEGSSFPLTHSVPSIPAESTEPPPSSLAVRSTSAASTATTLLVHSAGAGTTCDPAVPSPSQDSVPADESVGPDGLLGYDHVVKLAEQPPPPVPCSTAYRRRRKLAQGEKTLYYRKTDYNNCKGCGQPRLKATGHSCVSGYLYCPSGGQAYDAWKAEVEAKCKPRKTKKAKTDEAAKQLLAIPLSCPHRVHHTYRLPANPEGQAGKIRLPRRAATPIATATSADSDASATVPPPQPSAPLLRELAPAVRTEQPPPPIPCSTAYRRRRKLAQGEKTLYSRKTDYNNCKRCDQPRLKATGHSCVSGYLYCPSSGQTYDAWKAEVEAKCKPRKTKKAKTDEAAKQLLAIPPAYSHRVHHTYRLPANTEGQAGKMRLPRCAATPIASADSDASATVPPPQPSAPLLRELAPAVRTEQPPPPPPIPCSTAYRRRRKLAQGEKTLYSRKTDYNNCKRCGQPRLKATGHSCVSGYLYCPSSGQTYDAWKAEVEAKCKPRKTKKAKTDEAAKQLLAIPPAYPHRVHHTYRLPANTEGQAGKMRLPRCAATPIASADSDASATVPPPPPAAPLLRELAPAVGTEQPPPPIPCSTAYAQARAGHEDPLLSEDGLQQLQGMWPAPPEGHRTQLRQRLPLLPVRWPDLRRVEGGGGSKVQAAQDQEGQNRLIYCSNLL